MVNLWHILPPVKNRTGNSHKEDEKADLYLQILSLQPGTDWSKATSTLAVSSHLHLNVRGVSEAKGTFRRLQYFLNKRKLSTSLKHPIASNHFLLSATEGVKTTRSNRMKFRLIIYFNHSEIDTFRLIKTVALGRLPPI